MSTLAIEQLNKEADKKAIFCQINDSLFDADLMRGTVGEAYRNIELNELY
jgi:hypothetical protein